MAQGGPQPSAFYQERQALTRSPATPTPPTGLISGTAFSNNPGPQGSPAPGDGLVLAGLFAVVVTIVPWTGATLSGGGSMLCWVYNLYLQRWVRAPSLDIDLSDTSGMPGITMVFKNVSRLGMYINWLNSAVTASGGTDTLNRLDGFMSTGPRGT